MPPKSRPGRGVHEVLEELGLPSKNANLLRTQLLAYNDVHDKELTRSLGDDYDGLPLDVSLNFLNSHGGQFFGSSHSKWLWPKDSAVLVGRIAEIMRRQHAYKRDPTRKRSRSKSPDSTASRSTKSSRRTSSRSRATDSFPIHANSFAGRDGSDSLFPAFTTDTGNTRRNSLLPPNNNHIQLRSQEHDDDTIVVRPRLDRASRRSSHVSAALPSRPTIQQISQPPLQSTSYRFVPDPSVATPASHPLPQNPAAHIISTSPDSVPHLTSYTHPGIRRLSAMSGETQSTEQTYSPGTPALMDGAQPLEPHRTLHSVTLPSTSTAFHLPGDEVADILQTVLTRLEIWRLQLNLEVEDGANMVDKLNVLMQARMRVVDMLTEVEVKAKKAAGVGVGAGAGLK